MNQCVVPKCAQRALFALIGALPLVVEAHVSIVNAGRSGGFFTIRSLAIHAKLSGFVGDIVTL